jgi:PAS domain S-box-containing protein
VEDLDLKSKDELISEIKLLRSKIENGGLYFPGLNVISKYERENSRAVDKYKLLFQKSNDVIFVIKKSVITECNDKTEELFKGTRDFFIGKSIWDLCPMTQPDGANSKERIQQYIKSTSRQFIPLLQLKMLKRNGEVFDAEINFTEFSVGQDLYTHAIIRDVSERMAMSKLLKDEYEKRLEEQDITQSGNWEFNTNNFDVYWSPSAYAIHGLSRKKTAPTLNQYFEKYVHPDEKEILFNAIQESIRTGGNFNMDYKIITETKQVKYLHVKGKAIYSLKGEVEKIVGTVIDITERKLLEIELKESKESYEALVENLPEGVVIYTPDEILYANVGAFKMANVNQLKQNTRKYSIFDFILPKFKEEVQRKINLILSGKTLGAVEMKLKRADDKIIDIESRSNLILYRGKQAIQAIFSEITYRKQVEKSLRESERQLSTLISNLQGMAYRCRNDKSWTMEFVSDGCVDLTGYNKHEILNNKAISFNDIILKDDQNFVWKEIQKALKHKGIYTLNYRIKTKSGEIKWLHEQGKGIYNENNELEALEGFITDISKEKNIENALQKSHENYKNLVDFVPEGIVIHKEGKIVFVNQRGLKVFGFESPNELLGLSVMDFVLPEYREGVKRRIIEAYKGKEQPFFEIEVKTKSGEIVQVETRSIPFIFQNEPCILVAIHLVGTQKLLAREMLRARIAEESNEKLKNEITQKELAQKELLKSQIYTKNIINSSLDMIIANDHNLKITEFNRAAQIIFGYKANEVIGKSIIMLYASDEAFQKVNFKMVKEGLFSGEILNKRKNGEIFESFLTATGLVDDDGKLIGGMGVSRDVTKLKKEREKLHLSEERYKAIYNQVFIGIARLDLNGKYLQVNQRFCNILGYSESELLKMGFQDVTIPEELNEREKQFKNIINSKIPNFTLERNYLHKSGRVIQTNVNISLVLNEFNEPAYLVLVCEDITEAKKNQELFLIQTAKLNSILESSNYLVMAIDKNKKLSTFNTNTAKWLHEVYGVEAKIGLAMDKKPIVSTEKNNRFWNKKINESIAGVPQYFESKVVNKSGLEKIYEFYINPIKTQNLAIAEVAIIGYDITEKKRTEEKIITQSAKLNAIFENSSHQIYTIDRNFKLTSFNELFAKTTLKDYGIIASIGVDMKQYALDLIPSKHSQNFTKLHKEALKGKSLHTETKVINNNGTVSYYLIYLDPIILPDSKVNEVSYIAHDITDRKLAEKKIVESLKEKEVLLKEVHHRVKNNLQVISSILNLQRAYLKDKGSDNLFRELQNRVRSMSFIHESLYQTQDFSNLNFSEYLVNLTTNLKHSYLIDDENVTLEVKADKLLLNLDFSIPCGLIVNELISNAFKYAFPEGRKGKIDVNVKKMHNFVEIIVADDGVGIKPEIDIKNTESLGLQLVTSLVEQLDGELFHRNLNPGTEIKFNFEISNKN